MRSFICLLTITGLLTVCATVRADPLAVGAQAPVVTGVTDTGATVDLGVIYKKGYTLVYFFPGGETPGCAAEACSLRDAHQELMARGVTVVGVSVDEVALQKAFKEKNHLPFTLIADKDHTVMKAFGVPLSEQWGTGPRALRQSFLVGKEGKIVWRDLKASTKEQGADVLKALKNLGG